MVEKETRGNAPGWLITFEGGEGGGKSTQIARLQQKLVEVAFQVVVLREPGGTTIGEQIRQIVLSNENSDISLITEVLLFQAARAQIYGEIVLPSLKKGKVVLMDRSRDSSVVYQGMVQGFGLKQIETLNNISTQNTYPDLTFLLDISAEKGLRRRSRAGSVNRLDQKELSFHRKVRKTYLQLARNDGPTNRWRVVDASQPVEIVESNIWRAVKECLQIN